MNIKEIRSQYPQYNDLSDQQLADSLHNKFYADMPKAEFYGKVGFSPGPPIPQPVMPEGGLTGRETTGARRTAEDIGRSFTQGMALGGLDEATAAAQAGLSKMGVGAPIEYGQALELERERQEQIPLGIAIPGQIAGGIATTVGTGGLGLLPKGAKATIPRLAGVGALEGAVAGGLSAQGGAQERALGAGAGGVLGGILGAAVPAGVRGVQAAGRQLFRGPAPQQAERQLTQALEQTGLSPERLARRVETLGPQGTLADVAEPLTRLARGAAVQSPAASARAQATLGIRSNLGSIPRIRNLVKGTVSSKNFGETTQQIIEQRSAAAAPLYDQARQAGIIDSPELRKVIASPIVKRAIKEARQFPEFTNLADGDMRLLDQAYKNIGGRANKIRRAGDSVRANNMDGLRVQFRDAITDQVPVYDDALNTFSNDSSMLDALDMGKEFIKKDADVSRRALEAMSEAEREMFAVGASKEIMDQISSSLNPKTAMNKLMRPDRMNKIKNLFPNMKSFNEFRRALNREARFATTKNTVLGGSPTAEKLADARRQGLAAQVAGDVMQGSSTGTMAGRALARFLNREPSPEVAEALGPMLFGKEGNAELIRRLLAQQAARVPRGLGATGATVGGLATGIPLTAGTMFGHRF